MTQRIRILGIKTSGRHGITEQERSRPTELLVDAELTIPATTDDLSSTIDYREIVKQVRAVCETESFNLIETLAETVAERLSALGASDVRVSVAKPGVAQRLGAKLVAVETQK